MEADAGAVSPPALTPEKKDRADGDQEMGGHPAPHTVWSTFTSGWDNSLTDFYHDRIDNKPLAGLCVDCKRLSMSTYHYLCYCDVTVSTMRRERHDAVMTLIATELKKAIDQRKNAFNSSANWELKVMYNNVPYAWPAELTCLSQSRLYPHIVAYTKQPLKKVFIIEPKVSWEKSLVFRKPEKELHYAGLVKTLKENGFEVEFEAIIFGCRGVAPDDLKKLFEKFGMTPDEISKTTEEICRAIIKVAYDHLGGELKTQYSSSQGSELSCTA